MTRTTDLWLYLIEILHQTTTLRRQRNNWFVLYLIEILHQTTTASMPLCPAALLYLIEILHQTTTSRRFSDLASSCILSKFYIKPQLRYHDPEFCSVVSYRNSTSNHNETTDPDPDAGVVSYRNSTSNHNVGPHID